MTLRVEISGQYFVLHQSGVVFWESTQILLIADVHLGKIGHFRKHGIAIPNKAIFENFMRLDAVLELFQPLKVIFMGDLFHSKINTEWHFFEVWVQSVLAEIVLIEGNHDIIDKELYSKLGIKTVPELRYGNFLLTHHPEQREDFFNFCGHIHPGITLRGGGRQVLKLSCFFRRQNQLILPAFGEFTGNYYLTPMQNDIVYAITKEAVILVPGI